MDVEIQLTVQLRSDGRDWMALCPSIDVASQARTKRGALRSLREGVELWFESCVARNVLGDALSASGFTRLQSGEKLPEDAPNTVVTRDPLGSAQDDRLAESPAICVTVKRRRGQDFLEGYIPSTLARGGPYNYVAI